MRGVVLKQKTTPDRMRMYTLNSLDEPLRRSILYADQVCVAIRKKSTQLPPTPAMLELEAAGLLSFASLIEIWTKPGEKPFPDAESWASFLQFSEFTNLERAQPGVWSMDQDGPQFSLPPETLTQGRGVQVELEKLLPVPDHDVPISDILNFKQKRAPELAAFQSAMDGLYQMITSSHDSARAYEVARDAVQRAVSDMFRAMKESIATKVITSCKVALHVTNAMSAAQIGNVSGALGPAIQLATMATETPSAVKKLGPFAYVHQVIDDLM